MKDRFLDIGKKVEQKIEGLIRCALEMPPCYEEVIRGFRHGKNCSQTLPLEKIQASRFVTLHDSMGGLMPAATEITIKYVECPECHSSERYSG